MSNIINVNVATSSRLQNISVTKSSIKDCQLPIRTTLLIDDYEVKIGELVLVKDNDAAHNGVYKLKKLGNKGFLLTKQIDLTNYPSVFVYVNFGKTNSKSWFSMIRRTRNKSMIEFDLIDSPNSYPIRKVMNEEDKTEMELSEDTNALLRNNSVITEESLKDTLNKIVKSKESLNTISPFEPVSPLEKLSISSLFNEVKKESQVVEPVIVDEDIQANTSDDMKLKENEGDKGKQKEEPNTIISLKPLRVLPQEYLLDIRVKELVEDVEFIRGILENLSQEVADLKYRLNNCSINI